MSSAESVVPAVVERVRGLLATIPSSHRAQFSEFWGFVRSQFYNLEQRIRQLLLRQRSLEDQLATANADLEAAQQTIEDMLLNSQSTASRPPTSASIDQMRHSLQAAMDAEFGQVGEASDTVERIWDLDPQWVRNKLTADRESVMEAGDPRAAQIGCWMRHHDSNHEYGYTKVNWRNTLRPGTRDVIGCQPFRHQLAVVAAGYGQNLLRTSGRDATDEVSHLCHNPRCFNPDHVLVESKIMNRKRWACGGAWIIRTSDGTVYHPCPHGRQEHMRQCLLPRATLLAGQFYENSDNGPVLRD